MKLSLEFENVLIVRPFTDLLFKLYESDKCYVIHEKKPANESLYADEWITHSSLLNYRLSYDYEIAAELDFDELWSENRRNLIFLYNRQASKIENTNQIKAFCIKLFQISYCFLCEKRIGTLAFEDNPHLLVDFVFYKVASKINLNFHHFELFGCDSILSCKTNASDFEVVTSEKAVHLPIEFSNKNKRLLRRLFVKIMSVCLGGMFLWDGDLFEFNKGKPRIIKPSFFLKVKTCLKHFISYQSYLSQLNKMKKIDADQVSSRDVVIFMHFQPESSTMPYGGKYSNMLALAFVLSKMFTNRRIIIKEHPEMLKFSEKKSLTSVFFRSSRWMDKIIKQKNIFLLFGDASKILNARPWVVSINGTVLFENDFLMGKNLFINNPRLLSFLTKRSFHWDSNENCLSRGRSVFPRDTVNKKNYFSVNLISFRASLKSCNLGEGL